MNEPNDTRIIDNGNEYEVQMWRTTIGASGYWKTDETFDDFETANRYAQSL